jgi:hypothetical protein
MSAYDGIEVPRYFVGSSVDRIPEVDRSDVASVDQTDARYEVASGPETVESPFMLTNFLRC